MNRFTIFCQNIYEDFKGFFFFIVLFTIFRVAFIFTFREQLPHGFFTADTATSLWYGFRLSLKTVGFIYLVPFFFGTLIQIGWKGWPASKLRLGWYIANIYLFTLLFMGRIPFYSIYSSAYNNMLFDGRNDGWRAILLTAVDQYGAAWRFGLGIVLAIIVAYVFYMYMAAWPLKDYWKSLAHYKTRQKAVGYVIFVVFFCIMAPYVRFGASFNYNGSINVENSARSHSNLLNEAILDDGQALYRVKEAYDRQRNAMKLTFTKEQLKEKIAFVGGNPNAPTIDSAFTHKIEKEYLAVQPKQVVLIVGETYALWPFLPQYEPLGDYIVKEGKRLAAAPNATSVQYMLAHGTGTMPAVDGFLTGLAQYGAEPNYEPLSYKEVYGMGVGEMMRKLGYKTVFWYGGYGAWQNVHGFAKAQGFDEYHDAADLTGKDGNAWGIIDSEFFAGIEKYMKAHKGEKIFYFILTTSNHPPYTVDLNSFGFKSENVTSNLNDTISNDPDTVKQIGHIWYADHVMGQFVDKVEQMDPNTLFFITGDHSERFSFKKDVSDITFSAIPFIIYGKGVQKDWIPPQTFASAMQIAPTIAELVGRKGQTYESIMSGLVGPQTSFSKNFVFNHRLWIDGRGMHRQDQNLPPKVKEYIQAVRDISLWRMKRGNEL